MVPPTEIRLVQYSGLSPKKTLSPPCGKVRMALQTKGVEYRVHNVRSPAEIRRYNPRGRVPVLVLDDRKVVDSTDIVTEIERLWPEPALTPTAARDRAQVKLLEDWADEVLYFYGVWLRWCRPEGFERLRSQLFGRMPPPLRWIAPTLAGRMVRARCEGQGVGTKDEATVLRELGECLDLLDALLDGSDHLAGPELSRADLAVCAVLDQIAHPVLSPEIGERVERHAPVTAWRERVHAVAGNQAG